MMNEQNILSRLRKRPHLASYRVLIPILALFLGVLLSAGFVGIASSLSDQADSRPPSTGIGVDQGYPAPIDNQIQAVSEWQAPSESVLPEDVSSFTYCPYWWADFQGYEFVVDQAASMDTEYYGWFQSSEFPGGAKIQIFSKFEDAVACIKPGQTIHLCAGHNASKGTISKDIDIRLIEEPCNGPAREAVLEPIPTLKGNKYCSWGEQDCNVCVNKVKNSFKALNERVVSRFNLDGHPEPQWNQNYGCWDQHNWGTCFNGHWQGVQPIMPGGGDYMLVTRDIIQNDGNYWSGFATVQLGELPYSVLNTTHISTDHNHPGGVQAMGDYLVVGTGSEVRFFDISDPASLGEYEPAIGKLPDRGKYSGSSTAIAQLKDGRYLLAISASDARPFDFYVSDEPNALASKNPQIVFSKLDRWDDTGPLLQPEPGKEFKETDWDAYQSINLVTECGTGDLYLIGTGNRPDSWDDCWFGLCYPTGKDWADLYKLTSQGNNFVITKVAEKHFKISDTYGDDDGNFDAAAGVFVSADHRLFIYTTQHGSKTEPFDSVYFTRFGPEGSAELYPLAPAAVPWTSQEAVQWFLYTLKQEMETNPQSNLVRSESALLSDIANVTPDIAGYNIYRASSVEGPYQLVNSSPVKGDRYLDLGPFDSTSDFEDYPEQVNLGATFYYTITAVTTDGIEGPSTDIIPVRFGGVQFMIPDGYAAASQSSRIPVNVPNAEGLSICQADLRLTYDPAVLTPNAVFETPLSAGYSWASQVIAPGEVSVTISDTLNPLLYGGGALFELQAEVVGTNGMTTTLGFNAGESSLYDCDDLDNPVPLVLGDTGIFTVQSAYIRGDMDGDGSVSAADASLALDVSTGLLVPNQAQLSAGDVNGDGRITNADAVVIMRMVAGLPLIPASPTSESVNQGQAGTVTLSVPAGLTVEQGASLWVPVSIDSAANLAGFDLTLLYDSYAVAPVEVRITSLSQNFDLHYHTPANGELRISLKPKSGSEDGLAGGSGALVEVRFQGLADSQGEAPTPLNIIVARLSDRYGRDFASSILQTGVEMLSGELTVLDSAPPEVEWVSPGDGELSELGDPISITFNEGINPASLDVSVTPGLVLDANWNELNTLVELSHPPASAETIYTVTVSASDLAGNPMIQPFSWTFTTTVLDNTPPQVLQVSPPDGASNVEISPTIQITFSEQVLPGDLGIGIDPDHFGGYGGTNGWLYTFNYSGTVVTATQTLPFGYGTQYSLTVNAVDRSGNILDPPYQWSFTTLAGLRNIYLPLVVRK